MDVEMIKIWSLINFRIGYFVRCNFVMEVCRFGLRWTKFDVGICSWMVCGIWALEVLCDNRLLSVWNYIIGMDILFVEWGIKNWWNYPIRFRRVRWRNLGYICLVGKSKHNFSNETVLRWIYLNWADPMYTLQWSLLILKWSFTISKLPI